MYRRPCLWSHENKVSRQATSPATAEFLKMRTSCGEYVTLSEMINYEVTFQRIGAPAREVIMMDLTRWT